MHNDLGQLIRGASRIKAFTAATFFSMEADVDRSVDIGWSVVFKLLEPDLPVTAADIQLLASQIDNWILSQHENKRLRRFATWPMRFASEVREHAGKPRELRRAIKDLVERKKFAVL